MESLAEEAAKYPVFTAADIRAWRDGNWYFVELAGELVFKRHTRDEAFTDAWVLFANNRSPSYPRQRRFYRGVELAGPWTPRWSGGLGNRIEVPIEREKKVDHAR